MYNWATPILLATQETGIRKIMVGGLSKANRFSRPYFKNIQHKKIGLEMWLKW
jgi:hypothetical protein